jgi:hypothetical protein
MPTKIRQVKKKSDSLTKQEKQAFIKDLKRFGYLLPTNDEELEEFEKCLVSPK